MECNIWIDGSFDRGKIGIIIENLNGNLIYRESKKVNKKELNNDYDSNILEMIALKSALEIAKQHNLKPVTIFTDSSENIRWIKYIYAKKFHVKSETTYKKASKKYVHILEPSINLMKDLGISCKSIKWISRKDNVRADDLTKYKKEFKEINLNGFKKYDLHASFKTIEAYSKYCPSTVSKCKSPYEIELNIIRAISLGKEIDNSMKDLKHVIFYDLFFHIDLKTNRVIYVAKVNKKRAYKVALKVLHDWTMQNAPQII